MPLTRLNFCLTMLFFTPTALADIYSAPDFNNIHTVKINVHGTCCGEFLLSTKVGHLVNRVCHYQKETPDQQVSACAGNPFGVFSLNGQALERLIGNQWNCAATHAKMLTIKSKQGIDVFTLIKNTQGHYNKTQPASGTISLPICR